MTGKSSKTSKPKIGMATTAVHGPHSLIMKNSSAAVLRCVQVSKETCCVAKETCQHCLQTCRHTCG